MNAITKNDCILFQGDSITDVGRRDTLDGLGTGYVSIINGLVNCLKPELELKILNRGIGGDRTVELLKRWKEDCEDIVPDVLSIKIGVNDVWRILGSWDGQTYVNPVEYQANYRELLDRALAVGVRQLVLCSPTTIENGTDAQVNALLEERVSIVKALASEYKAIYVPFAEVQRSLIHSRPEVYWTTDGCHPSSSGHASLAWTWLKATGFV